MSTIAKKLKAIADSKEAIRKKLFISPEVPLSEYAELVPGSPAVVKPDQSTFDSALPFGRMKLLEASKEALRVGLGLPVAVPFSAYAEKIAAPAYAADFLTGNFRKNDVEVAFEEVAEFTRLSEATVEEKGEISVVEQGETRVNRLGLLMEHGTTNYIRNLPYYPTGTYVVSISKVTPPLQFTYERIGLGGWPWGTFTPAVLGEPMITSFKVKWATGVPVRGNTIYTGASYITADVSTDTFYRLWVQEKTVTVHTGGNSAQIGDVYFAPQHEKGSVRSSWIPTTTAPATRAPDILRVPLPAGHTLTLDADEGIKAERDGDFAVITADKPGYLRRFAVGPVRRSTMDFTKGEYKEGNVKVELSRLAEFTRLSEATYFQGDDLTEYSLNSPRQVQAGLLLEPESTNTWPSSDWSTVPRTGILEYDTETPFATGFAIRVLATRDSGYFATPHGVFNQAEGASLTASTYYQGDLSFKFSLLDSPRNLAMASVLPSKVSLWARVEVSATIPIGQKGSRTVLGNLSQAGTTSLAVYGLQTEPLPFATSLIHTSGSPATRAPDILRVPVSPTQVMTYDADPSIVMEMDGTAAVFTATEPGYIRSITLTEK